MLWTPISALAAAGVAIVGTAGSVIAVKQGLNSQSVRSPRTEQATLLTKDVARLPAGVREITIELPAPAQTLVDETTLFAYPPTSAVDEPKEAPAPVADKAEAAINVPLPAPRIALPDAKRPVARPVARTRIAKASRPSHAATQKHASRATAQKQPPRVIAQQQAPKPQEESWLSRLRSTLVQSSATTTTTAAAPKRTTTVAQSAR